MEKLDPKVMSKKSLEMLSLLNEISIRDSYCIFHIAMIMKGGFDWINEIQPQKGKNIIDTILPSLKKTIEESVRKRQSGKTPFDDMK